MLCALVDQAQAIEELVKLCAIVALSMRLLDGGDEVLWSAALKLSYPRGVLSIMMVMAIEAMLAIILMMVSIIAALFITAFVIVTWWMIDAGGFLLNFLRSSS